MGYKMGTLARNKLIQNQQNNCPGLVRTHLVVAQILLVGYPLKQSSYHTTGDFFLSCISAEREIIET